MNSLFPAKVLVATGPKYKDAGCTDNIDIEVDLVPAGITSSAVDLYPMLTQPPGDHGTPQSDALRNNQVMLRLQDGGKPEDYKGLNMLYLAKTTIAYCKSQDLVWDPKSDLLFLCQHYGNEIGAIRNQLDARQIQEHFLGTAFVARLTKEDRRRCYHVLLGPDREPPPSMSLTPAPPTAQRLTASAPGPVARPHLSSHQSSPSLNTMRTSSEFLSPPLPGKLRKQQTAPRIAPSTQDSTPQPQAQVVTLNPNAETTPRSRYRHNSAPSTPNMGQNSRDMSGRQASRTKPVENASQAQRGPPSHTTQKVGIDEATRALKPNGISHQAPGPMVAPLTGMGSQEAVSPLAGRPTGAVPVFSHRQNGEHSTPKAALSTTQEVAKDSSPPDHTMQRPPEHLSFQRAPLPQSGDTTRPLQVGKSHNPLAHSPPRSNGYGPLSPPTAVIARNSKGQNMQAQSWHSPKSPSDRTTQRPTHSLPTTSSPKSAQSEIVRSVQRREDQGTSTTFVFELDGSPIHDAPAPQSAPAELSVAELPAATHVLQSTKQEIHAHQVKHTTSSPHNASSPPRNSFEAAQMTPPLHSGAQHRPHIVHSQSASLDSLPASLMIGGRRRSPNNSVSGSPPHVKNTPPGPPSQQYHPPSYSNLSSAQSSPKSGPVTTYRAYSGPTSPPVQRAEIASNARSSLQVQPYRGYDQRVPMDAQNAIPNQPMNNSPEFFAAHTEPAYTSYPGHHMHAINSGTMSSGWGTQDAKYAVHGIPTMVAHQGQDHRAPRYTPNNPECTPASQQSPQVTAETRYQPRDNTESNAWRPQFEHGHQRNTSQGSQTSNTSHGSEKLAGEYQAELVQIQGKFSGR
jgi:hypothetical protein